MHLDQKIAKFLTVNKKTLATAESCTGGLLAHTLTNIPGSSLFFLLGLVAYDNQAKVKLLKIPPQTIIKYGAVSQQTASLMARHIRSLLKTDLGIGITGIAGPGGGSAKKPVGLVFISISNSKKTITKRFLFKGSRLSIKKQAMTASLRILAQVLAIK